MIKRKDLNKAIAELKRAFSGKENILLAYLFGSRVRGREMPISDYDLAVLLKDRSLSSLSDVLSTASKALRISEDKIDLLDLARAPLHLKARVLAEGVKIVDRGCEASLKLEVNTRYPEIARQTNELLKKWVNNPESLDLGVIKDRLDYLSQLGENLKVFLGKHRVEDLSEFEVWHSLKSMVQDSVQATIDVCAHIFSSKSLGIAESYGDYIEGLVKGGHMEKELAEKLKAAIVVRNRLIYRYLAVEPSELWNFAEKLATEVIPEFKEWTIKTVKLTT